MRWLYYWYNAHFNNIKLHKSCLIIIKYLQANFVLWQGNREKTNIVCFCYCMSFFSVLNLWFLTDFFCGFISFYRIFSLLDIALSFWGFFEFLSHFIPVSFCMLLFSAYVSEFRILFLSFIMLAQKSSTV